MTDSNKRSMMLNAAIIASAAALVALIIYSNRFHKNTESEAVAQNAAAAATHKKDDTIVRKVVAENHKTYQKAKPFVSPLEGVINPPKPQEEPQNLDLGGDIVKDSELKKALKRQTDDLRYELYSQNPHPNSKRALTLTKEEIKELEKSKRVIY